jgi:phage-related protein
VAVATRRKTEALPAASFDWHRGFELRDQDERAWYRVVYLSRINDIIYVLHCFEKKSRVLPRKEFEKARQRLKTVKAGLAAEKKHEKGR